MKKGLVFCCVLLLAAGIIYLRKYPVPAVSDKVQEAKKVALTFDDGPHQKYTKLLLDGLRERNVKATFFLIGESIQGKEELVEQMKEDGHLIGNHTYTHVQLSKMGKDDACAEIWKTNTAIYDITEQIPCFIRPPFGEWNEELSCAVDMSVVLWDIDPQDWKYKDTKRVRDYVVKNVSDGDIILLHDVYKTSVEAALQIVDILTEEGYEFVTVEEIIFD
ncbi:MAG: polysaccharide deacetylase family protein [Lachnospiraceae bacterium]|nr:polysaccharide deacetylase family protein [Lachnospiraceae bacterium]